MQQCCLRTNDISSRYLETRKATYPQEQVLFEISVDLKGILATACARVNLFHTEGNKSDSFQLQHR